ncbi:hypothetical protein A6M16_08560 [Streptococcus suis]|uniref:Uncharacterized protein n=1 Tax=Streptococcus suis D12 TaxID=1004952 RepID=G7SHQ3_STRSU|nr:hypothetical protein SSUD9_1833 [Streptococcus suis D9]AER20063.1 hypothetical protein SSUD12_1795 [Streptococcus suis D12]AND00528.1 hypothetical protein A6M16_08560 [Streptococcus suis]AOM75253.1 hypothetical protein BFP66_08455 [Streptococcus suis]MBS8058766.1 hypothetical protein [Streptococcus suis]
MRAKNLAKKINLLVCLAHFADFLFLYGFLNVRFSKRYFLKIELIQDIEIAHRQFRLVTRS